MKTLKERINATHVRWGTLLAIGPIIWSVYAVADTAGFDLDRVAWRSELYQVVGVFEKTQDRADRRELRKLEKEYGRLRREVEAKKASSQPANPEDIIQLEELKSDIEYLKQLLRDQ